MHACSVGPRPPTQFMAAHVVQRLVDILQCQLSTHSMLQQPQLASVVFCFLFALRADTLVNVLMEDVSSDQLFFLFTERKRKNMCVLSTRLCRVPFTCRPAAVLWSFVQWRLKMGSLPSSSLFSFQNVGQSSSASLVSSAIGASLALVPGLVPLCRSYPSHAIRRGAAISMLSVSVPLHRIMQWGAWSSESSVTPYLKGHAFVSPSVSDTFFFGWMVSLSS